MKKNTTYIFLIIILLFLVACKNKNTNANISTEIKITDWDNSKNEAYSEIFKNSIGLDVENLNSYKTIKNKEKLVYKEINTLYINNINEPISLKLNNNGKSRNFIITIFYDYKQIPFKISKNNSYDNSYKFNMDSGKEIELPLYLPENLDYDNNVHKLLVSFTIGYDINAGDYEDKSTWYGYSQVFDIIYSETETFINIPNDSDIIDFTNNNKTIDLMYEFEINKDYDYDILKTNILSPMKNLITTKKNEKVKLMYNVSATDTNTEDLMILLTVNFNQTEVNNKVYELIKLPKGKTGINEMNFIAPSEKGKYEVIAYLIYNPFQQNKLTSFPNFSNVSVSQRFTLEVK